MSGDSENDHHAALKAKWYAAIENKEALLAAPEAYVHGLTEQAMEARKQGAISAAELTEMLDLANAAYEWAVP